MSIISSWLSNNRVDTSFVEYRNHKFLVFTNKVGTHRVVIVEEVETGIREIPSKHPEILSGSDMDKIVKEIMDRIIERIQSN